MKPPMRIILLIAASFLTSGCARLHHPLLGTRVHRFSVAGVNFVHCSILIDQAQPQLAHDAIEVCRDEVQTPAAPAPYKAK